MLKKWKTLSREEVHRNPYWTAYHDRFEMPNGKQGDYYFLNYKGGLEVIAQREDGRVILVEQYRYIYDQVVLSFPGGSLLPEKSLEESARIELLEETGYKAGEILRLGERYIAPGLFYYIDTFFLARDLVLDKPMPNETEEFILHFKTPEEIDAMMAAGEIMSGNATCGWTLARPHLIK